MRVLVLILFSSWLTAADLDFESFVDKKIVLSTKRIELPDCPGAFNPSILERGDGYLCVFRYCPETFWDPWVNYIGVCLLNANFEPISKPELMKTREPGACVRSQAEDPRLFSFQNRPYVIYNDNMDLNRPWWRDRRDMFMAELKDEGGHFSLMSPLKLMNASHYYTSYCQKNWMPFEWQESLLLIYSVDPHEITYPNFNDGTCYACYETQAHFGWNFGLLRGSTPPQLVDGEYLTFFHSGHQMKSSASGGETLWHYFMGAYTFSKEPPFEITKRSPLPIVGEGFYTNSGREKRVIIPGGFVVKGPRIYVAYGRDDAEMWIAELDKEALFASLHPAS